MAKSSSANGAGRLLAKRYAMALIDVAASANALPAIENDMVSLEKMITENAQLSGVLANPVMSAGTLLAILKDISSRAGFHQLTLNFLGVLAANRRVADLPIIIQAFRKAIAARAGILNADVKSAQPLSATQQEELSRTLAKKTGKQVHLSLSVDPSLLGGMVVTIGSRMIDDSVKSKLTRLQQALSQGSNQQAA